MSILKYRCPTTSNEVVTAIETDRPKLARMRDLKVFVTCPHCSAGHRIPANAMYFGAQPLPPPAQDGRPGPSHFGGLPAGRRIPAGQKRRAPKVGAKSRSDYGVNIVSLA
jgi:hypothetical protein